MKKLSFTKISVACLCLLIAPLSASSATGNANSSNQNPLTIPVTETVDANEASVISHLIDALVEKVMACRNGRKIDPDKCQCSYPDDLAALKSAYDAALAKHPAWNGSIVTYNDPVGATPPPSKTLPGTNSLSFPGLKKQLAVCSNSSNP